MGAPPEPLPKLARALWLQQALREAQDDLEVTQRVLEEAKQRLHEVEDGIATMQTKYRECIAKKEELELKCEQCEQRLSRADKVGSRRGQGGPAGCEGLGGRRGGMYPFPSPWPGPPQPTPRGRLCSSSTGCRMRRCAGRRLWRTWSICLATSPGTCWWLLALWPTWAPSR